MQTWPSMRWMVQHMGGYTPGRLNRGSAVHPCTTHWRLAPRPPLAPLPPASAPSLAHSAALLACVGAGCLSRGGRFVAAQRASRSRVVAVEEARDQEQVSPVTRTPAAMRRGLRDATSGLTRAYLLEQTVNGASSAALCPLLCRRVPSLN